MFKGTWLTYKLYDGTLPMQGIYIIESYGHVFHVGQADNLERRRGEHARNGVANGVLDPDTNFIAMPVPNGELLDGIEAYLGRVLAVPQNSRYPVVPEIACSLPEDLPLNALSASTIWNLLLNPIEPRARAYDVLRRHLADVNIEPNDLLASILKAR